MKIFLVNTGYIDIAHVLSARCKKRLLKRVLLAARDEYTLSKYKKKIPILNYSRVHADPEATTPLEQEKSRMEKLRGVFRERFEGAGDLLMVCGCEAPEAAALPVVQDVCRELGVGFHVLFIAPFLFEGQRRSQALSAMMRNMSADYESVSLYYPDELLRVIRRQNSDDPDRPVLRGTAPSLSEALEALEEEAAILTLELSRQIPKLDRYMQYTYDFKLREFSLAVEPEKLLEKMWRSVADDKENFKDALDLDEEAGMAILRAAAGMGDAADGTTDAGGDGTGATAGTGADGTAQGAAGLDGAPGAGTAGAASADRPALRGSRDRSRPNFKIPLVGMFARDAEDGDKEPKPSAYNVVTSQSIPVGAYNQQVGSSSLDRLVDGIKVLIGAERGEVVDPARIRKMQARLAKEINKFQVRQNKAVVKYGADVPTTMRTMDEALASIYLSDEELALEDFDEAVQFAEEFMPQIDNRNTGSTPFQRAALAATANQDQPKSWAQIKAERVAAGEIQDAPATTGPAGSAAGTVAGAAGGTVVVGQGTTAATVSVENAGSGAAASGPTVVTVKTDAGAPQKQTLAAETPDAGTAQKQAQAVAKPDVKAAQTAGTKAPAEKVIPAGVQEKVIQGTSPEKADRQVKAEAPKPAQKPAQPAAKPDVRAAQKPAQPAAKPDVRAAQTGGTKAPQVGGVKAPQVGGVKAPQVGGVKAPKVDGLKNTQQGGVDSLKVGGVKAPKVGLETNKPPGLGKVAAPDMSKVRAVDAPPLDPPSRPKAPEVRPQEPEKQAPQTAKSATNGTSSENGSEDSRSSRAAVAMAMLGAAKGTPESRSSQQIYGGRTASGKLDVLDTRDVRQKPMNADDLRAAAKDEEERPETAEIPETSSSEGKSTWAQRREERQREKLRKKLQKAEEKAALMKAMAEEAMKEVELISKQDPNDL